MRAVAILRRMSWTRLHRNVMREVLRRRSKTLPGLCVHGHFVGNRPKDIGEAFLEIVSVRGALQIVG